MRAANQPQLSLSPQFVTFELSMTLNTLSLAADLATLDRPCLHYLGGWCMAPNGCSEQAETDGKGLPSNTSQLFVHRSSFIVHRSSFIVHRSSFTVHRSPSGKK
jgi:hypothetical protein